MSKKHILTIAIVIIAITGSVLFIFRHEIIEHAIKISIRKKTHETISLNIGDVYYDVFNSTVSFTNCDLLFNNIYINSEKTIKLSILRFANINIDGLSLFSLLFERKIIADKFIITKPSLWFNENNNPIYTKEKPKKILESLQSHQDILKNLTVIVGEVEITDGTIELKSLLNNKIQSGSVDFKLDLKKINTTKNLYQDKDRLLFAEEHILTLTNFNYTLPNGNELTFDSLVFRSSTHNIITNNIKFAINSDTSSTAITPSYAQIQQVTVGGINFEAIERLRNFNVDSISISNINLFFTDSDSASDYTITDTSHKRRHIFSAFHKLNLNLFTLNNFNLLKINHYGDTLMYINKMHLSVGKVKVDSLSLANKIPDIDYKSLKIASDKIKLLEDKLGININVGNFKYSERAGLLSLFDFKINDQGKNGHSTFIAAADTGMISGISIQSFLKHKPLKLGVAFTNPIININQQDPPNRISKKKNLSLENIEINNVKIKNGTISLVQRNKLNLYINNLNLNTGNIHLVGTHDAYKINTNNLIANTSSVKIIIPDKEIIATCGSIFVRKNTLKINNISTRIDVRNKINSSVFVNQLVVKGINISQIVDNKTIDIKQFTITKPKFKGQIDFRKYKIQKAASTSTHKFNYKININNFELLKGDVNFDMLANNNSINLISGINITIDNIFLKDESDTTWFSNMLWKTTFTNPVISYNNYLIKCKNIISNKFENLLSLNNIEVKNKAIDNLSYNFIIRKLTISKIKFSGLNYNTIIDNKKPVVKAILVQDPYLDLKITALSNKDRGTHRHLTSFKLPIDIQQFEVGNLSLKVEKSDSASDAKYGVDELSFKYDMTVSDKLIDGISYFNLSDFSYSDTTKNIFSDIDNIVFSQQGNKLIINNITGGSINKKSKKDYYYFSSSTGIVIGGIDIGNSTPDDINIRNINFADFDITINKNKSDSKTLNKKKLELPTFIKAISIDSISGNNINISNTLQTDTTKKNTLLHDVNFLVSNLTLNSNTIKDSGYKFIKEIDINLSSNHFVSADSLYISSIKNVNYNFYKNELVIDSLQLKPRYKAAEFFKKAVYQTGKMDITTSKIVCSNIRLNELIKHGGIHVGSIDIFGLKALIFKNKKYEINPTLYKKMPQEALLGMKKTVTIDSLKTHNAYIYYKQLNKKSIEPGDIFLTNTDLSIFNLNNNIKTIDNTSTMVAIFEAKLLGESALKLKMTFPILSPANDFWVTGYLGNVNFTKLNPMTQNLVGITLKKGIGRLDIPLISGNSRHSEGTIDFRYKKLKLELYDRDKARNATGLVGSIAGLLLNDIFIKNNNPGFMGKTRSGEVYFVRNTQKSIISYTWKSILSGIMSTMGYNNKEKRQEKRANKHKMNNKH